MTNEKDREKAIDVCPCCGGIAVLVDISRIGGAYITCRSCDLSTSIHAHARDAIKTWNNRSEIARIRAEAVKSERERCEKKLSEWAWKKGWSAIAIGELLTILSDDQEAAVCTWRFGGYLWSASCGATWEFPEGSPEDNSFRYCPHCGKPVKEEGRG